MSWETIVTIYAAIIATIVLVWNIIESKKKEKPNFQIYCGYKINRSEEIGVYYLNELKIRVINIKDIPRKVKFYGIEYVQGLNSKQIRIYDKLNKDFEFSDTLKNSDEHIFEIDDEVLKWFRPEGNSKFRIVIIDNSNNYYRSKFYRTLSYRDLKYNTISIDASQMN